MYLRLQELVNEYVVENVVSFLSVLFFLGLIVPFGIPLAEVFLNTLPGDLPRIISKVVLVVYYIVAGLLLFIPSAVVVAFMYKLRNIVKRHIAKVVVSRFEDIFCTNDADDRVLYIKVDNEGDVGINLGDSSGKAFERVFKVLKQFALAVHNSPSDTPQEIVRQKKERFWYARRVAAAIGFKVLPGKKEYAEAEWINNRYKLNR